MIINKKIIRNIKEQKVPYIGSIVLIALSSMLFIVFNIMGTNVTKNLAEFKEDYVQEDASFVVQSPLKNISELESKYNLILEERNSADYAYDKKSTLRVLSKTKKVNQYVVLNGEDIKNNDEILIDPEFAKAHRIKLKQKIKLFQRSYTVIGFVSTPDYIYPLKTEGDMMKNPSTFGIAVVNSQNFKTGIENSTFYSVKYKEDKTDAFKKEMQQNHTIIQWTDRQDNMRMTFIEGDLKGVEPMGKIMPVTILFITCILVSVVFGRLLKQEFSQLGVLYALGYRKMEIRMHYLTYSIYISLLGGLLGTLAGCVAAKPFITYVTTFYSLPIFEIQFDIKYILIAFLLPMAFLIPTTMIVIGKAMRLSPLQLLRGEGSKTKIGFLEKKLKLQRFRFITKFQIREVVRNTRRTILLVIGVTFASSLLLVGFSTKDSMDYLVNNSFNDVYHYNYQYVFNSFQTEQEMNGATASFAPFTSVDNEKSENSFLLYGLSKDSWFIKLKDPLGKEIDLNQVIITKPLAEKYDLQEGDTFHIKSKLDAKDFSIKIDKVAESYMGESAYMPLEMFNKLCGYPEGSYLQIYSNQKLNIEPGKLLYEINKEDIIDGYQQIMKPFQSLIGVIGVIAFIIGLIIIYVVTTLIIEENKSSVSLLKILGYRKKELFSMILNANTSLVVLGYLLSIPLVLYSLDIFFKIMTEEMSMSIPVKLHYIYLLIGFVFIIVTYEMAKFLNRKKIQRISMADSLKNRME
ncbi:ABC transporter permease [Anaerosacchariphilus polymeriproducens]|uniref:ABC transporter permease n=1 Tax=Anaerosacchariphilus polymeriproducens TaxID=1812858 RepID=A0A371AYP6_9FIRM|nr:ABC transporter permease [Anaerosacchariphilus polymeriproducens]RDU24681.1 ABC transporter permease [Anaerosacchariphilus polymeriproducens]